MQKNHSHQFCQLHSLCMALCPTYRRTCDYDNVGRNIQKNYKSERKCAYIRLLGLLNVIFQYVIFASFNINAKTNRKGLSIPTEKSLHHSMVAEIKALNLDQESVYYHTFIEDFMTNYIYIPTNQGVISNKEECALAIKTNIMHIMTSDLAKNKVPEFK